MCLFHPYVHIHIQRNDAAEVLPKLKGKSLETSSSEAMKKKAGSEILIGRQNFALPLRCASTFWSQVLDFDFKRRDANLKYN